MKLEVLQATVNFSTTGLKMLAHKPRISDLKMTVAVGLKCDPKSDLACSRSLLQRLMV